MTMLVVGLVLGWLITGLCDYFATKLVAMQAYERGRGDAMREYAGW